MYEIAEKRKELKSLSIFVGTGKCNAKCPHCAGVPLRKYAPKEDGIVDLDLIERILVQCYKNGARYLSISSSGEPTLSPKSITKVLRLTKKLKKNGVSFSPTNLYSNGIRIGQDEKFTKTYLPLWQQLGLTTIYLTIHDIDERINAQKYGIAKYPEISLIIKRIEQANLNIRANLVLSKESINTCEKFIQTSMHLKKIGINSISAWVIRNSQDQVDKKLCPDKKELEKIAKWIKNQNLDNYIRLLIGQESRKTYKSGQKLTLFPDGTLSNTWCNN